MPLTSGQGHYTFASGSPRSPVNSGHDGSRRRRACRPRPPAPDGIGQLTGALSFLAIADLRLAAWFLWITPLLTAWSSFREASRINAAAFSASPPAAASWNLRMAVFREDLTDLLRSR